MRSVDPKLYSFLDDLRGAVDLESLQRVSSVVRSRMVDMYTLVRVRRLEVCRLQQSSP